LLPALFPGRPLWIILPQVICEIRGLGIDDKPPNGFMWIFFGFRCERCMDGGLLLIYHDAMSVLTKVLVPRRRKLAQDTPLSTSKYRQSAGGTEPGGHGAFIGPDHQLRRAGAAQPGLRE
jgi:hypothetical protein